MKRSILCFIVAIFSFYECSSNNNQNQIQTSGTIEAKDVMISSKVAGEVISIIKDEGDKVSIGDTLMLIDTTLYKIKLREAEALLASAEAQLELILRGARKEDIVQAEQLLKQAEINLQTAKNDKTRFENLFESKAISKKQYEDVVSKYEIALSQYNSAQENYSKLKSIFRPEELKQAKANVDRLKANLELIKKNLNDCYVTSPINGMLVKRFVEKGETVTNLSSLMKISDLSLVELIIYVNEKDLPRLKLGQSVDIKVDAFADKTFEGKIVYISPEAEFTPKNIQTKDERTKLVFAVKVKINNPDYELKAGIPADAVIKLD
jgi:HlyD family secretion protein